MSSTCRPPPARRCRFGSWLRGHERCPAGVRRTPIVAVLADSHAALFGQGCTEMGMAKATYGTGSSVMAPVADLSAGDARIPVTLAWVIDESPTYALEGNILSSGATLAWAADLLTDGRVADLVALAETVPDSGGVTLVPAFAGLGAPHWDRNAHALISGMSEATARAHLARASVDSISHQICDIVDVIEERSSRCRFSGPTAGPPARHWSSKRRPTFSAGKSR